MNSVHALARTESAGITLEQRISHGCCILSYLSEVIYMTIKIQLLGVIRLM